MVREAGLEPACREAQEPKSCVSTVPPLPRSPFSLGRLWTTNPAGGRIASACPDDERNRADRGAGAGTGAARRRRPAGRPEPGRCVRARRGGALLRAGTRRCDSDARRRGEHGSPGEPRPRSISTFLRFRVLLFGGVSLGAFCCVPRWPPTAGVGNTHHRVSYSGSDHDRPRGRAWCCAATGGHRRAARRPRAARLACAGSPRHPWRRSLARRGPSPAGGHRHVVSPQRPSSGRISPCHRTSAAGSSVRELARTGSRRRNLRRE